MSLSAPENPIEKLGPWFHNIHLPDGRQTAPDHFLGDFPRRKWTQIAQELPQDLTGWSVLDIGCNAGFYSFELAKRGAEVTGIDSSPLYLNQARWVSSQLDLPHAPVFRQMQVYDLARTKQAFDLVLFMGVFYHLRYPLLALDTVASRTNRKLIFQSLSMPGDDIFNPKEDYTIDEREVMLEPGWPKMAFIEKKMNQDGTNWWAPNHACMEALLRSTGFSKIKKMAHEIYFCDVPEGNVARNRDWDNLEWLSATGGQQR